MIFSRTVATAATLALSLLSTTSAITLPTTPAKQDYITAANVAKENAMTFYGGLPGPTDIAGYMLRPDVYYWWQAGGLMGQLIQHWNLTGNSSYNDLVMAGILNQVGDQKNFEPANQSKDLGNDDQLFWAFAAMDAAEYNFPAPDNSTGVSWLGLAQAVFNRQAGRWDTQYCNGGLRWQIFPYNNGYNYKNAIVNVGLMALSARLYRFTGNETYGQWAERLWDWSETTGMIATNDSATALHVYDGFGIDNNCKPVNQVQFTYNFGVALLGTSFMYNATKGNSTWLDRVNGLMLGLQDHIYLVSSLGTNDNNEYPDLTKGGNILLESADEMQTPQNSDNDDPSFKGYTVRWMAVASQLVPSIRTNVSQILEASAQGAAAQCTGQSPNSGGSITPAGSSSAAAGGSNWCGRRWYQTKWDTYNGYGEQMSAAAVFQNNLITMDGSTIPPPITANTGGTSVSQPDAGSNDQDSNTLGEPAVLTRTITTGDKAGAAIMTIISLAIVSAGLCFMVTGD